MRLQLFGYKSCPAATVPMLTHIVNLSLQSGHQPQSFKNRHVRPLLKKPHLDPEDFSNYRPVSNLPSLAKVLEKVVTARLYAHLSKHDLQEEYQSAAVASVETALVSLQNYILRTMIRKHVVCCNIQATYIWS